MTGEKNRFKTTEKLWDLDEKQLKSPVHDAMVLWLMDEDNLKALLFDHCDKESYDVYSDKTTNFLYAGSQRLIALKLMRETGNMPESDEQIIMGTEV